MIRYTQEFTSSVQGKLVARFQLKNEQPVEGEEDGTKFYFINLSLEGVPSGVDIRSVTYFLDASTYWEPERVSRIRQKLFTEAITSYGDFLVRVEVKMNSETVIQKALLSDMLEDGHPEPRSLKLQQAIDYIRAN